MLKLNESSFVFDFLSTWALYNALFEITRPAAIFSCCEIVKTSLEQVLEEAYAFEFDGVHYKIPEIPS